jgi:hypothetical protein
VHFRCKSLKSAAKRQANYSFFLIRD